jgi:hypothetical protein
VNDPGFGVESLYAAHLMQTLANQYNFGRGAQSQTRGQTRYLFIMVAVDLVKDFLINEHRDYGHSGLTSAIIAFSQTNLLKGFGDAAVQLIDDYLTNGNEDCLFEEPEFQKSRDLNAFLKWEKLRKGDEFSPRLRTQMTMTKKIFRRAAPASEMQKALATETSAT